VFKTLLQKITPWGRAVLEKITIPQLVQTLTAIVHYCSHKSPPPVPTPIQSKPGHAPSLLLMIHFNIIFPSTPRFSKWFISLGYSHQNPLCNSRLSHTCHMPRPIHSSWFYHPKKPFFMRRNEALLDGSLNGNFLRWADVSPSPKHRLKGRTLSALRKYFNCAIYSNKSIF
jgi:hypothetical protein